MSYFPAFIKLDNTKILIVGGGNIAHEKLSRMLDFTKDITIIAREVSSEMLTSIEANELSFEQRRYEVGDVEGFGVVIVAVDDLALQEAIFYESKSYNCLCNAVDSVAYCDFIFPSYVKQDDLTIAISTSGASPAIAKHLKRYIQQILPENIFSFLKEMKRLRSSLPKGKERMKTLDQKAETYFKRLEK